MIIAEDLFPHAVEGRPVFLQLLHVNGHLHDVVERSARGFASLAFMCHIDADVEKGTVYFGVKEDGSDIYADANYPVLAGWPDEPIPKASVHTSCSLDCAAELALRHVRDHSTSAASLSIDCSHRETELLSHQAKTAATLFDTKMYAEMNADHDSR